MSLSTLRDVFAELFAIGGARFVEEDEFLAKEANKLEKMYQKTASVYAPYLTTEPVFDRTHADAALCGCDAAILEMDVAFFRKLLAFARSTNWGKMTPATSSADRGRESFVYRYYRLPEGEDARAVASQS